jgi:Zn-dependent M16 (insulinase) family peptidase
MFSEEGTPFKEFNVNGTKIVIRKFAHSQTGLGVYYLPMNNPLSSSSIVVPTLSYSHSGHAHTLEHLIFCGSETYKRGFLDLLASRCLSTGTNAYTSEDHTAYTLATASGEGQVLLSCKRRNIFSSMFYQCSWTTC